MPPQSLTEAVKDIGSPEAIHQELAEFQRSARVFSSDRPRLLDKYCEQWVGVIDGEVVTSADSFTAVLENIDAAGLSRSKCIVRFITKNARTLIL